MSKKLKSTGDAIAACDSSDEALGIVLGFLMVYAATNRHVALQK